MSSSFDSSLNLVNLFYFNNHNNHSVDLLVGEIIIWPTNTNYPKGFLLCDGSEYSSTEYSDLKDVIETTYGSGTGTFKVPNMNNKHIRSGTVQGNSIQVGGDGGNNTIELNNLPSHNHTITYNDNDWTYDATSTISYNISSLVIHRAETTMNTTKDGQYETDAAGDRATSNHTHNISYATVNHSFQYNSHPSISSVTNYNSYNNYLNDSSFTAQYINSNSPYTGTSSYVPKSKKVYYLIYSGKH